MQEKRCLLSVAMIMRDEAHNLDRALGSIRPYVDEIVVVDTGSKDESVEIAKKYTDKIYFYQWHDDFSAARNFSLQFPTCEWVLIYDADEEVKEDFAGIREFLENLPPDVNTVYLPTISYLDWDLKKIEVASTARIFRNGTVRYENIVHNQAIYKGKVVDAPFKIYHYGYIWTRKLKMKKYNRTRTLLVKLLEEKKEMSPLERMYYLAQLYKTESIYEYRYRKYPLVEEILKLIEKEGKITSIVLEVLFLHGLDLYAKGLYDLAQKLFDKLLKVVPNNPDPYYGLLAVHEARKEYDKLADVSEKFFESLKDVEEHPEKYGWTIMSIKYKGSAHALASIGYLKKGNLKSFKEHFYKIVDEGQKFGEDLNKILRAVAEHLILLEKEDYLNLSEEIDYLLKIANEHSLKLPVSGLLVKDAETGRKINPDLYERLVDTRFEKLLLRRLKTGSDELLNYLFGEDLVEAIEKFGVGSLVLYMEHSSDNDLDKVKTLAKLRKSENQTIRGVAIAFIADIYLRMGQFKAALNYYKEAVEELPELSRFVKPVLDDLKTKLSTDVEGVFEEIKEFYTKNKEFFADLSQLFDVSELQNVHLLSDSDLGKYISAVYLSNVNKDKAKELLESLEKKNAFPFYYFRYAKLYEGSENQDDLKKAYDYHLTACRENFKIGDLFLGLYEYDGFYPEVQVGNDQDEIVWVGNMSEKHSGLGVISPVRMWRKGEEYYYAVPFPVDEVLKVYKDRLKKFKLTQLSVGKDDLLRVLSECNWSELFLPEDEREDYQEMLKSVTQELGMRVVDKQSSNVALISFESLNTKINMEEILAKTSKGVLFYFIPDFSNRENIVWYYPYFRVFRTRPQIEKMLKSKGFKTVKHVVLSGQLRAVIFES